MVIHGRYHVLKDLVFIYLIMGSIFKFLLILEFLIIRLYLVKVMKLDYFLDMGYNYIWK